MPFRFVHTADLHLDSPLRSLALRDADLAELVAGASRNALRRIIDLALAEQVDALLIAGDLYDGAQTSMKTARFLAAELARLDKGGIRGFIIRGNHDAMSRITRELTFPPGVHVFGARAEIEMMEQTSHTRPVAVHGISFAEPRAPDSLLPGFAGPVGDAVNIGMMHSSLDGSVGHDVYAPCSLGALDASGFDYWALGHIHQRRVHQGGATVVMPGIPQGRHIGEPGAGSASLITIRDDGTIEVEARLTALVEFQPLRIDLTGAEDWRALLARIHTGFEAARSRARCPNLILRPTLTGVHPQAARLWRDQDLALAEAQEIGRTLGQVWVEKLVLDLGARPALGGALADLASLVEDDIRASAEYLDALERYRETLQAALPPESRDTLDSLDPDLVSHGIAQALARLRGTAEAT